MKKLLYEHYGLNAEKVDTTGSITHPQRTTAISISIRQNFLQNCSDGWRDMWKR